MVAEPPIPEPMITPALFPSKSKLSRPASLKAMSAEATPNWVNLSIRLDNLVSIHSSGLKTFTSAAIWEEKSEGSKWETLDIPFLPAFNAFEKFSTPIPIGVTIPNPVITTLFSFMICNL